MRFLNTIKRFYGELKYNSFSYVYDLTHEIDIKHAFVTCCSEYTHMTKKLISRSTPYNIAI